MKVGDLVEWNGDLGIVYEIYESKCWRLGYHDEKLRWADIDPEPFARVCFRPSFERGVPIADLDLIQESS